MVRRMLGPRSVSPGPFTERALCAGSVGRKGIAQVGIPSWRQFLKPLP